jgi:hypothetical protein
MKMIENIQIREDCDQNLRFSTPIIVITVVPDEDLNYKWSASPIPENDLGFVDVFWIQ